MGGAYANDEGSWLEGGASGLKEGLLARVKGFG